MKIVVEPSEIRDGLRRFKDVSIGFIPTMGALHEGHISLIEKAKSENEIVVVSIFINPTQFDSCEDLNNYPSTIEEDISILNSLNVDYLFNPNYENLYPDKFTYQVEEREFSRKLCGKSRNGHFTGVLTVVMKLLNIVKPTRVYFGEKDRQQLVLIKGMVEAFFLDVQIVPSPTIREKDGLAMSSRNRKLKDIERKTAGLFPALLSSNKSDLEIDEELNRNGFRTDYIETLDGIRYGAVFLGKVRLIDNVKL